MSQIRLVDLARLNTELSITSQLILIALLDILRIRLPENRLYNSLIIFF